MVTRNKLLQTKEVGICYAYMFNPSSQFLNRNCFSDEATFYTSGNVNRHNLRIWGSENPHHVMEFVLDRQKVNVTHTYLKMCQMTGQLNSNQYLTH